MSLGIDISNTNGTVDLAAIKAAHPHLTVVGIKRDEGTTFRDSFAAANFAHAGKLGLVAQFYHFGRPDVHKGAAGGLAEADFFLGDIAPFLNDSHSGIPVLDYESVRDLTYAHTFCAKVQSHLGKAPLIYASGGRLAELSADPFLRSLNIWVAVFGSGFHQFVPPGMRVVAWQYTDAFEGRRQDASHILVDPRELLLHRKVPHYLYVRENGRLVKKVRFGGGRVRRFLDGTWLKAKLLAGKRIRLRRAR